MWWIFTKLSVVKEKVKKQAQRGYRTGSHTWLGGKAEIQTQLCWSKSPCFPTQPQYLCFFKNFLNFEIITDSHEVVRSNTVISQKSSPQLPKGNLHNNSTISQEADIHTLHWPFPYVTSVTCTHGNMFLCNCIMCGLVGLPQSKNSLSPASFVLILQLLQSLSPFLP